MNKFKQEYEISKTFYLRLTFYIVSNLVLIAILVTMVVGYFKLENMFGYSYGPEVCDKSTDQYNVFYCMIYNEQDGPFYDFIHFGLLIFIISLVLGIIILQVFYIANGFYFKRYVVEHSYGAVIYRINNGRLQYLIQSMSHGHKSLCKGHSEPNETPEETALREVKEETGLTIELDTNFSHVIKYHPSDLSVKYVTFFAAENTKLEETPADNHDEEVAEERFLPYEEAMYELTYDLDREVLRKAHLYISNKIKK
jgi:8-oxo-dGTP pyrophosphatase MutT (NUDIX family)